MKKIRNPVARAARQRGGAHIKSRKAERRKAHMELPKLAAVVVRKKDTQPGPSGLFYAFA